MNKLLAKAVVIGWVCVAFAGCTLGRSALTSLSEEQAAYYSKLRSTLQANRNLLEAGLEQQLEADLVRQRNLVEWERDLVKAEVLLRTGQDATGAQKLLHLKLAELDLGSVDRLSALEKVDEARKEALLKLYDEIIDAVEALAENTAVLTEYLASDDAMFAIRSLDVGKIVSLISTIRAIQAEMGMIDRRTDEERRKESDRVREALERAREVLVSALGQSGDG